jgi:SNF2 family DNA or RNA helicase
VPTALPDAALLTPEQRRAVSLRIKKMHDIAPWPDLKWFNSDPCARHAPVRNVLCRRCGILLRRHQRVGAAWLYVGGEGLLADACGLGKTGQVLAMLAMCKENGELGLHSRAVIVCKAAAVHNVWGSEIARLLPGIPCYVADGDRGQRARGYLGTWEVAVVSDRTFAGAHGRQQSRDGDVALLEGYPVSTLVYDDIDPMRTSGTQAAKAVNQMAGRCTRVAGLHATPLQKGRLPELWGFLEPVGGEKALGSLERVQQRYTTYVRKLAVVSDPRDRTGRTTVSKWVYTDNGIVSDPRRIAEFRAAIAPLVLRRTAADVDDVELPAVQYSPVFLDLSPRQRARYEELRRGWLRRLKDTGAEVTRAEALVAFTRARQICSGLAALDEGLGRDDSAKLDWVMDKVTGDLSGEKMVCFVYFRDNVAALSARLRAAGVGHVLMWSGETSQKVRARRLELFRGDPRCQVLVGTTTIEASLNLQVAAHLAAVDTIPNPARMEQLLGRVRRDGSPHPTVYFHHLLARDTVEDAYLPMLRREAAVADAVWDEQQSLFTSMTPREILRLVATGRIAA